MDPVQHDPSEYGRNFADVYDRWYPGGDEADIVTFVADTVQPGARVLELGVGTGRVALELAAAEFRVTGLDSSAEMLAQLAAKDPRGSVEAVHADAGDPSTWPRGWSPGSFDCVLAACNLLLNLTAPGAQRRCIQAAASVLSPGGSFITERSRISMPTDRARAQTPSTAETGSPVIVRTDADPRSGIVRGQHVVVDDTGESVRNWRIRVIDEADYQRWCSGAGLREESTHPGWTSESLGESPGADVATVVSVHRLPAPTRT